MKERNETTIKNEKHIEYLDERKNKQTSKMTRQEQRYYTMLWSEVIDSCDKNIAIEKQNK